MFSTRLAPPAAALALLLVSGGASATQVLVTINGTLSATDWYSNTWPTVLPTQSTSFSSIVGQAFTARIVYETNVLTPARNQYEALPTWGDFWENTSNGGNNLLYESFVVSSDITIYGQTIAMDTTWNSKLEANDTATSDRFYLTGGDLHGPAADRVDDEYISLTIDKVGAFPVPFVANVAPVNPLSLVLSAANGTASLGFKLFDYPTCKTISTTNSLPVTRNCPADRFTGSATHWVEGSGAVSSVTIASVVPVPAAVWFFGSALAAMGWLRRRS